MFYKQPWRRAEHAGLAVRLGLAHLGRPEQDQTADGWGTSRGKPPMVVPASMLVNTPAGTLHLLSAGSPPYLPQSCCLNCSSSDATGALSGGFWVASICSLVQARLQVRTVVVDGHKVASLALRTPQTGEHVWLHEQSCLRKAGCTGPALVHDRQPHSCSTDSHAQAAAAVSKAPRQWPMQGAVPAARARACRLQLHKLRG